MIESKNIVFIAKSLDGYIAGKNGELDWLEMFPEVNTIETGYTQLMQEIDAIVMGRVTFETVLAFGIEWPYKKPVFVLSTSMSDIPNNLKDKVFLISGNPAEILKIINDKDYKSLYIDGGSTIQGFLKADLIDELRITTFPILLGGGFSLFGELNKSQKWKHIETHIYLGQLVQSRYIRSKE